MPTRWLARLFRRDARVDVDGRHVRDVLEAYGACLALTTPDRPHRSERELPYSKEEIGRALLHALRFATAPETVAPLRRGFVELERFLADDEWPPVDAYQRDGAGMADAARVAARGILAAIETRCAQRLALLTILDAERRTR